MAQFDLVAISETWLTCDITDSKLLPWGYDIFRYNRKSLANSGVTSHSGGVLLVTCCELRCKAVDLTIIIE